MMDFFTWPLPPYLLFFVAAIIAVFMRSRHIAILSLIVPFISFYNLLQFEYGEYFSYSLLGFDFVSIQIDRLSLIFGYLFHLAAFIGLLFAYHLEDKVQQVAALAYAGSAIGAVFSGDWLTLLVFWELLALTSVFLILASRTKSSYASGMRYLIMQVLSGVLLLTGVLLLFFETGDTSIRALELGSLSTWIIFLAFGIKCGFPLFHTWIVDSYPEATPTGTVFMASFTTKVSVYAFARVFAGEELLLTIGLLMACLPIFYAVIENDLRRVLAYSMINQIGFMICGIGVGTDMAINGAVATAFNHVIYKGLLMMTMGAVLFRVGHVYGSHLGGLYKTMPRTTLFCVVGAASISAFPLFSGFVSKGIIMAEVLHEGHTVAWLLLLFAAAGVFHHAGIKIPFFAFFAHDSGLRPKEAPINMQLAMGLGAFICIFIGIFPVSTLYQILPFELTKSPYDITHVVTQLQLLLFSALAFVALNMWKLYPPELKSTNLDSDWFYRKLGSRLVLGAVHKISLLYQSAGLALNAIFNYGVKKMQGASEPKGWLAKAWSLQQMLLVLMAVMLVVIVLNLGFLK